MKAPHPSSDPQLQSLTDEAADLPILAAAEARQRRTQRRKNQQRCAFAAAACLIGVVSWSASHPASNTPLDSNDSPKLAENESNHPADPRSLPSGLSPEQAALVKAAGDMPLLLVRNRSGQVTRIHVIER